MGQYLPDDILNAMREKYGMRKSEIEKAYYFYWKVADLHARASKPDKVENITDGNIPIPHIGTLKLRKKVVDYVRTNLKAKKH